MFLQPSHRARSFVLLAVGLASACGGATARSSEDAGRSSDAAITSKDAAKGADSARSGDASCIEPVLGEACIPGVSVSCPPVGDVCCIGYEWECDTTTNEWAQLGLGCACRLDAGLADAGSDASPVADASGPCGLCAAGDLCVVTTAGGGACELPNDAGVCSNGGTAPPGGGCCDNTTITAACQHRPAACSGELSCGCAASLCSCMCTAASGSTVQCACEYP